MLTTGKSSLAARRRCQLKEDLGDEREDRDREKYKVEGKEKKMRNKTMPWFLSSVKDL